MTLSRLAMVVCVFMVGCDDSQPSLSIAVELSEFEPSAHSIEVAVTDRSGTESGSRQQVLDELSPPYVVEITSRDGDSSAEFGISAELFSLRGRLLAGQQVWGQVGDGMSELSIELSNLCVPNQCGDAERCVLGVCRSACLEAEDPRCQRDAPDVYLDADSGVDAPTPSCAQPSTPCQTIQYALDEYVTPGVVFHIKGESDTRYSSFVLEARHSGTAEAPVVLRAWSDTGTPTLDARDDTAIGVGELNDRTTQYIRVEDLRIINARLAAFIRDSRAIELRRLEIEGPRPDEGSAILVLDSQDVVVTDSVLSAPRDEVPGAFGGINTVNTLRFRAIRNVLSGFERFQLQVQGDDTVVRDNVIWRGESGILVRDGASAVVINNRVCDHSETAIQIANLEGFSVTSNTVVGAQTGLGVVRDSREGVVRNNIFLDQRNVALFAEESFGISNSHNLFFGGSSEREGVASDAEDTDVRSDPEIDFVDPGPRCANLQPSRSSEASTGATDGRRMGAD